LLLNKFLKHIFKNNLGATLVQVIIAGAVLSAISLVVVQLGGLQLKQEKSLEINQSIDSLMYHVQDTLLDKEDCMLNIVPGSNPPAWKNPNKLSHYKAGAVVDLIDTNRDKKKFKERGFTLDRIELIQQSPVTDKAELKLHFSRASKFIVFGLPEVSRSIAMHQHIESGNIYNCFADFGNSVVKNALNAAIAKSCGIGLRFNGDLNNPRCVIDASLANAMACPSNEYITDVRLTGPSGGPYNMITTCKNPITCGPGQMGMVVDGNLTCVSKCSNPNEVGVFTNSGFQCRDISCPSTASTVQYLAGISNDGIPTCKNLASTNVQCGQNGFRLIATDASGSVRTECCNDCPSGAGYCSDQLRSTTGDCGVKCYGSEVKQAFNYASWGPCSKKSSGFCTKTRTRTCPRVTTGGYECCTAPQDYQPLLDTCTDGTFNIPSCPTNNTAPSVVTGTCSTNCCDQSSGSSGTLCPGRLQGGKTWDQCTGAGGKVTAYRGSYYCEFNRNCPGGWSRSYLKSTRASATGRSHGFCGNSSCSTGSSGSWTTTHHSCVYCTYRDYDTWSMRCYCSGSNRRIYASIYAALCR